MPSTRVTLNPVTRISGFMAIHVTIEHHQVTAAQTEGMLFRGFEQMLIGRQPWDAVYFTQRICGICSAAHSTASTLALENAMNLTPSEQGRYLRDIIHGCEFLQNHIRHFYQYTVPDYVRMPQEVPLFQSSYGDFRLPTAVNDQLIRHYFASLPVSRAAHEMIAILGGKAPHNHGIFVGGITTEATVDKIMKIRSLLAGIRLFIETVMIADAETIARYYPEYFHLGRGYGRLLSFGCFDNYPVTGTLYVDPSLYRADRIESFDPARITEEIEHSRYTGAPVAYQPLESMTTDAIDKPAAYSWIKAARYQGQPFETGPLARQWLSGAYRRGISAMDRTIARVREALTIARIIENLLDRLEPADTMQTAYSLPQQATGQGLIDTTRGALGHWLKIADEKLSFYQVITPSVWNLSSQGNDGQPGTGEAALIGTPIQDPTQPVELGRIIRSFDPCVSCATHVFMPGRKAPVTEVIVP
ncbi:nickel-dependent hydrogenase large subunit [Heliophilum fasciatum]|uniref:Hydrogenase large subunit n=1 Tax=Heliophilum fasciatum TaxID=35700 RepID=A0A4R2RYL2_9FIRM|nr:nickel-dependent hydrogenase large subunit [Heliophilum fasciatum]MCW2276846.1 hydrogenase large subunit [Heliophilum fasciatum]TCP68693.1 hydrogenase large subunit [Heliophilum fasciatum]